MGESESCSRISSGELEQLPDARESVTGGGGPCLDGFVCAVKIIPRERVHVRTENEIGVSLPYFKLMFLGGAHSAAHDLENIGGGAVVDILNPDGDGQNAASSKLPRGLRGNRSDQAAVGKPAGADLDGFEQTGKCTTGADGVYQRAVSEDDRFTIGKVGSNHGHGDAQVFKAARFEYPVDEVAKAVIAGETQTGDAPSGDIAEAKRAARCNDTCKRSPAGVGRAKNAAHAGAGDGGDGDVILL